MKKIIQTFLLLFIGNHFLMSQNAHGTATENYIYEKTCLDENCEKKIENIQYLDGLNRPKQVINIKATPQGNDMITPFEYDNYGVQSKNYLPIPQTSTGNGNFNTSPKSNGIVFYGTNNFYSELVHDGSFLAKVSEQSNPGDEWTLSSGKTVKSIIDINKNSDNVKKYIITPSWDNLTKAVINTISQVNLCNEGELYKTIITDEDNNRTITFKNKLGKVVLIRKENNNSGNIVNIDTYYVYNFYNQLAYIIPPLAAVKTGIDQSTLDNLCYQYKYDVQGRLVEKKLPGKGFDSETGIWRWDSFVYDKADRLILTQDASLQQQGKWLMTKYDQSGRIVYTSIILGGTRESMQSQAGNIVIIESKDSVGFNKNGMQIYYTNNYFHVIETVLSINYYDSYPQGTPTIPSFILNQPVLTQDASNSPISTKSLPTASYVKNIEDDNWTKTYSWYDAKGRAIGSHSVNYLGGYTKTELELGFTGEIKESYTYHKRLNSDNETIIKENFGYDNQNRFITHKHKVNFNLEETLAVNDYNELSQLRSKQIGGTGNNPIQIVDYLYNIRGWLTGINNPSNLNNDLFGYTIKYNNPVASNVASGRFNGNIAEIDWKTFNDGILRRYNYQYDGLNRLLNGIYSEPDSYVPPINFYNESLSYDINGNISTLVRKTKGYSQTAEKIDDLTYAYTGNRLDSVTDSSTNYSGYPEASGNLISYDFNGNMKDHLDRGILQINYNFLDLPNLIKFDQTYLVRNWLGTLEDRNITTQYTYRADGTKLKKIFTYGISKSNTEAYNIIEYNDGFQYEIEGAFSTVPLLKFVPTQEGYYDFVQGKYIYQYKDQVGNIRLAYYRDNNSNTVIDRTANFYPFGMEFNNATFGTITPHYNYGFQGQEKQLDTGWSSFKWRNYDPSMGRFFNIDPLSEKYAYQSHYNFSENRVVNARELEGLEAVNNNDREASFENKSYDGGIDGSKMIDGNKEWQIEGVDTSWKEQDYSFRTNMAQENAFDLGNSLSDAFFGLGSQESWNNYNDSLSRYESAVANSKAAQAADGFYYMFGGMLVAPFAMGGFATLTGASSVSSYLSLSAFRGSIDILAQYSVNGNVNFGQTAINGFFGGGSTALRGLAGVAVNVVANTTNSIVSNPSQISIANLTARGTTSSILLGVASLGGAKSPVGKVIYEASTQLLFNLADKSMNQQVPVPTTIENK